MEYDFDETLKELLRSRADVVRSQIADACAKAGRDVSEVTLVGVSKVFPVSYAEAAVAGGLMDLGENKVQELVPKIERLNELGLKPNWHLIGTLQKNKVKYIAGKTHLIHSVNTIELAQEIDKRFKAVDSVADILMQVNVSGEESKHGFAPEESQEALEVINGLENVRVRGLMTMAPIEQYEGQAREVFHDTRDLFEKLRSCSKDSSIWNILSMGMSHDYESAILEGSTCIRIGTAIFGDRSQITG